MRAWLVMGRKRIEIDWERVDEYLKAQCDGAAIARMLNIHPDTLYSRCEADHKTVFSAYAQQKKEQGKEILRRKQFDTAMAGNVTMLIWLGKQYLEQSDKQQLTGKNGVDLIPRRVELIDSRSEVKNDAGESEDS